MAIPILRLLPHLTRRPWGGNRLDCQLRKALPTGQKIGESWELSDHPDGPSRIDGGPFHGQPFGDLLHQYPQDMVGIARPPTKYPLLVKYIDAAEDLSIQVHPDDRYTREKGIDDRGKTECWYILDCLRGTEVIYGLKEGITRRDLENALASKSVPDVLQRFAIHPGTFLFVPAGTVHAVLGGTLLCEIQQSSNVTFRLWDWDRKPEREIHARQSLEAIDYNPRLRLSPFRLDEAPPDVPRLTNLTSNPFFTTQAIQMGPGQKMRRTQPGTGVILNGVEGECRLDSHLLQRGDTYFVPACISSFVLETDDKSATVLASSSNELR